MRVDLWTNVKHTEQIEDAIQRISKEYPELEIELRHDEGSPERIFPGLEDPEIQRIVIRGAITLLRVIYKNLQEGGVEVQISRESIENLKWELIEAKTDYERDDIEVVDSYDVIEADGMWVYEFKTPDNKKHELKIYADNLDVEHKVE